MSDSEAEDRPAEVRIPSAWRAMRVLSEAWEMLEANPDLMGEDVALALASEAPEVPAMLDAIILTIKKKELFSEAVCKAMIKQIQGQSSRELAAAAQLRRLLEEVMPRLRLPTKRTATGNVVTPYRSPAGLATLGLRDGKITITNEDLVPDKFKTVETVQVVRYDMRAIAAEFDADRMVDGAVRGNSYNSVTIR